MESDQSQIVIRIKTLDNSMFDLKVPRDISIQELKTRIEKEVKVPVNRQRLIFQGKLLGNVENLMSLKVEDGHVLHLIALPNNIPVTNNESPHSQSNTHQNLSAPVPSQEVEFLNGVFRTINESASQRRNVRRRMMQQRVNGFSQNLNEAKEVLKQNLITVQQILNSLVSLNDLISNESFTIYNFQNRRFQVGQWVDIKDSMDQWFEGQIVNINHSQVMVHYNGIGYRREEWIDSNSPRITPFRSHTVQSASSTFLSPSPNSGGEAEKSLMGEQQFDLHDFLYEFGLTLNQIFSLLFGLNLKIEKSEKSEQGGVIKNTENEIDMKSFITGMIEENKQTDNKFGKNEIDVASLKSLKSVEKNSIDYDASSMKSIKSYISNSNWSNFQMPTAFQGYISEENEEDESQDVSDTQSNLQAPPITATRELENYLIASQIAPLFDRMGRLMVDMSPLLAMHGANLQHHFSNAVNVQQNLSNISIITNEGSTISSQVPNHNQQGSNSNRTYYFQVPIMLTPAELLSGVSHNPLPVPRPENNNIDIHIHTFLHSNQNPEAQTHNSVGIQTVQTRSIATGTDDLKENFEEEKYQAFASPNFMGQAKSKPKEKRNSGYKPNFVKEQDNFNNMFSTTSTSTERNFERERGYFRDLQSLREEKEVIKNRLQNTPEFYDHKEPKHVSFKGLKKLGDERNRASGPKFPKSKYFLSKDEKELTSKNLLKKTQELENLQKINVSPALSANNNDTPFPNERKSENNANISFSNLTPFIKSNEALGNPPNMNSNNESHRGSINSNNSNNNSRASNCGRQLY